MHSGFCTVKMKSSRNDGELNREAFGVRGACPRFSACVLPRKSAGKPALQATPCAMGRSSSRIPRMKLALYFAMMLMAALANGAELPVSQHNFVVIAHRGDHTLAHENTLTALQHAIDAGVDYAEIDVRRTADDQYVLMHDGTVNRMTDGHGAVRELSLAQIRALTVRDPKRPQIPPDRVPTFSEALGLIKGRLNIYLDFKEGDRAAVAKIIRDAGVARQIIVYDDVDSVSEWHRAATELALIISPPDGIKDPKQLIEFATGKGIEILDGNWRQYSREMVEAANRAGVRIWPDIQTATEDTAYFAKVLALGFSGVQTDHPEELITWLKSKNLR